jgi:2-polyprenyl-3-methyl-5-hydroxy-6-metoxy-1,4-benzoquinol methylase
LEQVPVKTGRLLLLGVGGGREAIPLARLGFEVTGVDFLPQMVQTAQENAARQGVHLEGLVQEISAVDVPPGSYDLVWLSYEMYSSVPTRQRRVRMLRHIHQALRPGGYFICTYHWQTEEMFSPKVESVRKIFALLTLGNLQYEPGDMLWSNSEFLHAFSSEDEIKSEFAAGGFAVLHLHIPETGVNGGGSIGEPLKTGLFPGATFVREKG